MPRIVADSERISAIRHEANLRFLRQTALWLSLVENRADPRVSVIGWQIDLDGNSFPAGVRVRLDQVTGNIARQDRDRVHPGTAEIVAEAPAQAVRQPANKRLPHFV